MSVNLVKSLFDIGAIKVAGQENDFFTYASGKKGPIYCDTRKILFYPETRDLFVNELKVC